MKKIVIVLFLVFCNFTLMAENIIENKFFVEAPENTVIYSIEDGMVLDLGYDVELGMFVKIDYPSIGITVTYCNLKSAFLKRDEKVYKGNKIGKTGITGNIAKSGITQIIQVNEKRFLFNE